MPLTCHKQVRLQTIIHDKRIKVYTYNVNQIWTHQPIVRISIL